MGYYLSEKNRKTLAPYLKLLETSKTSLTLSTQNPRYFKTLLLSAFNLSHPHLKDKYKLKVTVNSIICERVDIQLEIDNIVAETVDLYRIADDLMNKKYPIKYLYADITPEDVAALQSLPHPVKLTHNPPQLEISYVQD